MEKISKEKLDQLIDSIEINQANLEHIAKSGKKINGTLRVELWRVILTAWAMGTDEQIGSKRSDFLHKGICLDTGKEVIGTPIFNKLGCFLVTEENPHICTANHYMEIDEFHRVDPEQIKRWKEQSDG